ncbi:MAG: trypsin-like peptidase domain-containing protein [Clostridia bacterium]|nr:trypsin-like peptidase domain-containing protein [Clostridia bacterium]
MKKNFIRNTVLAVVLCGVIGLGIGSAIPVTESIIEHFNTASVSNDADVISTETTGNVRVTMDEASQNTVEIINKVKPTVACITSITQGVDFFNQAYQSEGAGSGIVFYKDSDNAYIVTNYHVVSGASQVGISLSESDLVEAKLVGKDSNADLAVLSVSLSDLAKVGVTDVQVAEFGDSEAMEVGETVIAIGNALGEGNTATKGILSSQTRDVNIDGTKLTVLQTDAAINPGNSGGALVNSKGQVIGINTAKISMTTVEGIGYSIASDVAKPIIEELMNSTSTPTLGVYITSISEEVAQQNNLPQAGVLVQKVIEGGSASYADIQAGDLITSFNGTPVFSTDELMSAVKECKIGQTVSVTIVRNGTTKTVSVKMLESSSSTF